MKLHYILFAFLIVATISACKEELSEPEPSETIDLSQLNTKWMVTSGTMNEVEKELIREFIFDFTNNQLITTFPEGIPMNEPLEYQLEENTIKNITGSELEFTISKLTADTLILNTSHRGDTFSMILEKPDNLDLPELTGE
jgi:hypothetical protein